MGVVGVLFVLGFLSPEVQFPLLAPEMNRVSPLLISRAYVWSAKAGLQVGKPI